MKEIYQIEVESHDSEGRFEHFSSSSAYATYDLALSSLFVWYKEDSKLYPDCVIKKDSQNRIIEYSYVKNGTTFFVSIHSFYLIGI